LGSGFTVTGRIDERDHQSSWQKAIRHDKKSTTALDLCFAQLHQSLLANFRLRKLRHKLLNFSTLVVK
jgi:DTW domain-containing protein YfiP